MSLYVPLAKTAQFPKRYYLTQGYSKFHQALDLVGSHGQKVLAPQSGRVFASSWEGDPGPNSTPWAFGGGNVVIIDHFGAGKRRSKSSHAHLLTRSVKQGQYVMRGQVIGSADSTGNSTGQHLHWSVAYASGNPLAYNSYQWVDPRLYMAAHSYQNGSQGNGSQVNNPYFRNTFIVNASVRIRSGASLSAKILKTTKVKESIVYLDTVNGSLWSGSDDWVEGWHPTLGICYVHSVLGVFS